MSEPPEKPPSDPFDNPTVARWQAFANRQLRSFSTGPSHTPPPPVDITKPHGNPAPDNATMENYKRAFTEKAMPEKPAKPDFWTFADKATFGVCEALALVFCLPFGDDLYHDKPLAEIGGWHWFYLVIGLLFAGAGPMFPWLRTRTWIPEHLSASLSRAALDARIWIAALLIAFLYLAAPEVYLRATKPIAVTVPVAGFTQQQGDEKIAAALANLNGQLAEANRQKNAALRDVEVLRGQIKNAAPQPPTPEDQIPVTWETDFQLNWYAGQKIAWIRFVGVSAALARIKDAYVISTLTGHKEPLDIANATNFTERWKIDQVEPIPSGAKVILVYEPKPPPSLPDFVSQWGAFEFHVVYDNKEYVKTYSQDYINSKMTREMPGIFGPRVTPRNDK